MTGKRIPTLAPGDTAVVSNNYWDEDASGTTVKVVEVIYMELGDAGVDHYAKTEGTTRGFGSTGRWSYWAHMLNVIEGVA